MTLYLDTSALVKIYVKESFSDVVRSLFCKADSIAISKIGFVEFNSAISRLYREKQINREQVTQLIENFKSNWSDFIIVELDDMIIERAAELLLINDLRAFDSIHLASALSIKNECKNKLIFGCFDKRLNDGASALGLELISINSE